MHEMQVFWESSTKVDVPKELRKYLSKSVETLIRDLLDTDVKQVKVRLSEEI